MMMNLIVATTLALVLPLGSGAAPVDVMSIKAVPLDATDEQAIMLKELAAGINDAKERQLQAEKDPDLMAKAAFYSSVVVPAIQSKEGKEGESQLTKADYHRDLQEVGCVTLDDGSLGCIVEPNFPEDGLFTFFFDCIEGQALSQCLTCSVAQTCCASNFQSGVTGICQSCGVCLSSATNLIEYSCSGSSCASVDCSNNCVTGNDECDADLETLAACIVNQGCDADLCFNQSDLDSVGSCAELNTETCKDIACCPACSNPFETWVECLVGDAGCDIECSGSSVTPAPAPAPTACDPDVEVLAGCFNSNGCDVDQCFNEAELEGINNCDDFNAEVCKDIECCPGCADPFETWVECLVMDAGCDVECSGGSVPPPTPFPTPLSTPLPTAGSGGGTPTAIVTPQPQGGGLPPVAPSASACSANIGALTSCLTGNNCNVNQCFDERDYSSVNSCIALNEQFCGDVRCCPPCINSYESLLDCLMREELGVTCDLGCDGGGGGASGGVITSGLPALILGLALAAVQIP